MNTSRHFDQELEKMITAALRAVAVDEAKQTKSNKTRKVPGFKFPNHKRALRFTMKD